MRFLSEIAAAQEAPQEAPGTRRVHNVLAGVLVALFIALAWQGREPDGVGGADELEYRALSLAIEQGTYREIYQPEAPYAVKYPPAFPAWLAVLRAVIGDHLDGVRFANILMTALALTMVFLIVRQLAGGWIALGTLAASALNPSLLEFTGSMMSEPMYILTSTAAVGAAFLAQRGHARMAGAAIAFALLAFLTRSAGITIVVSIGIWLLLSRRRTDFTAYAIASVLVLGAWFGYAALAPHEGATSYGRDLSDAAASQPAVGPVSLAVGVIKRVTDRAVWMATRTGPVTLGLPTIEGTLFDNVAWLGALVVFLPIGLLVLWRGWPAMVIYVVIYGGLVLVWPYSNNRILCVIAPLLLAALLIGARTLARLLPFPHTAQVGLTAALAALMVLGGFRGAYPRYLEGKQCARENRTGPSCYMAHAHALVRAGAFIRANSRPGDIAVSSKAPSIFFLTDLQTIPTRTIVQLPSGTAVENLRARNVRFAVISLMFEGEDGGLARQILPQCRETKVEFSDLPNTLILSPRPPGETSDEACTAIPEFIKGLEALR